MVRGFTGQKSTTGVHADHRHTQGAPPMAMTEQEILAGLAEIEVEDRVDWTEAL